MENQVTKPPMILVVEPDPVMLTGFAAILDMQGYRCFLARNIEVALQAIEELPLDLIVFSIGDSLELALADAKQLRSKPLSEGVPIIFIASYPNVDWIGPLNSVGGVYCLPRTFEPQTLLDAVEKTLWMPHLAVARVAPPKSHLSNAWVRLS
jgi:DNA-binding response OmpR family regulator